MHAKVCDRTGQPVAYRIWAKNSYEWPSRIHSILLQIDRLQLTAVYCNRREGWKDNTSEDPFSRWEFCMNLGYILSGRWQDTVGLQHPEGKNFVLCVAFAWWNAVDEKNHLAGRWGVRHQWQSENQDPENQHEAQHEHVSVRVVLQSS